MKSKIVLLIVAAMLLPATAACGQTSLDIGDPGPLLSIVEWVKGRPIDLKRDVRKKIHVVEFWAVWCPPCKMSVPLLTQLQKKYEKDVVIVGVTQPDTSGNTPSAIRKFVADQGKNMEYTVAIDDGKTTRAYLGRAGVIAIPHCFVLNRDGRIVWQGSPLEPALDDVLGRVVAGTFDIEAAKLDREVQKRLGELELLLQYGQWGIVWEGLLEILKLDPANEVAMRALVEISVEEMKNTEALRTWIRSHIKTHGSNGKVMGRLAYTLCGICDVKNRFPDLALEAAKAAYEASRTPEARSITVYARALYQIGELDRAIALQQDAVAVADAEERGELKGYLDYYRKCKKLQGTHR